MPPEDRQWRGRSDARLQTVPYAWNCDWKWWSGASAVQWVLMWCRPRSQTPSVSATLWSLSAIYGGAVECTWAPPALTRSTAVIAVIKHKFDKLRAIDPYGLDSALVYFSLFILLLLLHKSRLKWHLSQDVVGGSTFCPLCVYYLICAPCGAGAPLFPPLSIYFLIFSPFYFSLSFIGFTYFLLLSIPSLCTRIVPLRFQAGGRRRRQNVGLVFVV